MMQSQIFRLEKAKCRLLTYHMTHLYWYKVETQYLRIPIINQLVPDSYAGAPVGMWTLGRVHTKFWQPP